MTRNVEIYDNICGNPDLFIYLQVKGDNIKYDILIAV